MTYLAKFGAASIGMLLCGCAIHPLPEDVTRKTTYDIVRKIRCEAKQGVLDNAPPGMLESTYIAYEFLFTITENNNSSGDATFKYPFTNGTFTLGLNAGAEKQRVTDRNFRIVETFADLKKADCSDEETRRNWKYPIAGSIGLYEVIQTYVKLENLTDLTPKSDVPAFADKLMDTTKVLGGVKPSVVLTPIASRFNLAEANLDFNADRTDVHQVTVALSVNKAKKRTTMSGRGGMRIMSASPLSQTIVQSDTGARERVLLELDRQRLLDQNARILTLLGLTP